MEHKKGEIRGQLDFSDLEDFDPETGEIYGEAEEQAEKPEKPVLDFRKHG